MEDPESTRRILVVEDDREMRTLLASVLRRAGHHVLEAPSGEDALRMLLTQARMGKHCDLLVTDWHLPELNGVQLGRALQALPPPPAIILVTAFADADAVAHPERLGVNCVLSKPFEMRELLEAVERCVLSEAG
jgi:two-component system cell cycle response regulator CpdR